MASHTTTNTACVCSQVAFVQPRTIPCTVLQWRIPTCNFAGILRPVQSTYTAVHSAPTRTLYLGIRRRTNVLFFSRRQNDDDLMAYPQEGLVEERAVPVHARERSWRLMAMPLEQAAKARSETSGREDTFSACRPSSGRSIGAGRPGRAKAPHEAAPASRHGAGSARPRCLAARPHAATSREPPPTGPGPPAAAKGRSLPTLAASRRRPECR